MPYSPEEILDRLDAPVKAVAGTSPESVVELGGHASTRIYHRLRAGDQSFIVMELGPTPHRCEEICSEQPPSKTLPFVEVQQYLAGGKRQVPALHAYLVDDGLLLLEDLGDQTLEDAAQAADTEERVRLYRAVIDELIALERYTRATGGQSASFLWMMGKSVLKLELDHFREWLLEADRSAQLDDATRTRIDATFERISSELAAQPRQWAHRDLQSRNVMVQHVSSKEVRLGLLDFQDALLAPPLYDLVSLLRDSYIDLGLEAVQELMEYYQQRTQLRWRNEALTRAFWLQTLQRKLKDAGRFIYIARAKGNEEFLQHVPLTLTYIGQALDHLPDLQDLRTLLQKYIPEMKD